MNGSMMPTDDLREFAMGYISDNEGNKNKLSQDEMKLWLTKMDKILDSHFVFNGDGPNEIIPNFLWLGDAEDAKKKKILIEKGITWILNCAGGDMNIAYPINFKVHTFKANDDWKYNLIENHITECIGFIDKCRYNGDKILIHCIAGMNRSATITVAYLLHYFQDMDLLQAIEYTVKRRSWILTNGGFRRQLIQYAKDLNKLTDYTPQRPPKSKL